MRSMPFFLGALILVHAAGARGQDLTLESLLRANSHPLEIASGSLSGDGFKLIMDAAADAQFVAIAEEHNVAELNEFATVLFTGLSRSFGFRYLALEQGSVITSWLGDAERRGDLAAIAALVRKYPVAPTFATDGEMRLIAAVGATSPAPTNPIWGVDQEFGALHILDRLAELAPDAAAAARVEAVAAEARVYEFDRSSDTHYLSEVATPEDFADLPEFFHAAAGSEAAQLIAALQRTSRIYHNNFLSRQGQATSYENGREREQSMKLRFMEQYRLAQAAGDPLPRVLAKLGHWHIFRGIYRSDVPTFGNFLSGFAQSNGMTTFILSTCVVDSPEAWRNTGGTLAAVAGGSAYTVIDLRPLRPYAHQGMIPDLDDGWKRLLFRADALLVIRGGKTGSYSIVGGGAGG